jgi:hypothetical protein
MITLRRRVRGVVAEIPHAGYFAERVCIYLMAKDLTFLTTTKSPQEQEYVCKGVREVFNAETQRTQSSETGGRHTPIATQIFLKIKGLREKQFVRP